MRINGKVILLMYDNPITQPMSLRQAEKFRKAILRIGFVNLQKSIYVKIIRSKESIKAHINKLEQIAPERGDVKMLVVPLKEFKNLINIRGEEFNMELFSDEVIFL